MIFLPFALFGCSLIAGLSKGEFSAVAEESRGKDPSGDLLIPIANYSTEKGKYLGERYNRNLEHLLAQIVQDRVTRSLQFADTTLSIKSIGFFTHSASKSLDERYLEVILWVPDVFDDKIDLSVKLDRLFSQYGPALLDILSSDSEIYNEKRVTGFGLNFSWRTTSGSRITLERAVIYLSKDEVKKFLIEKTGVQDLLTGAVIFSTHVGRSGRVQYSRAATKPELKPHATSPPVGKVEKAEIKEADIISLAPVEREGGEQVAAIEMEATSFAVGVGYTWGNGKLWFKEKEYTFSVSGLSLVGVGISTVKAKGDVLHLKDLADFSGTYVGFSAGGALGKGGGGLTMKNEKGVVINVVTVQEGLKLSIGPSGFAIKLKD